MTLFHSATVRSQQYVSPLPFCPAGGNASSCQPRLRTRPHTMLCPPIYETGRLAQALTVRARTLRVVWWVIGCRRELIPSSRDELPQRGQLWTQHFRRRHGIGCQLRYLGQHCKLALGIGGMRHLELDISQFCQMLQHWGTDREALA